MCIFIKGGLKMNFIYDVLLNFNDGRIYDFYEWGEKMILNILKSSCIQNK